MDIAFNDSEKRLLLVETIKTSDVSPGTLLDFVRQNGLQPVWDEIQIPPGRNVKTCRQLYRDLITLKGKERMVTAFKRSFSAATSDASLLSPARSNRLSAQALEALNGLPPPKRTRGRTKLVDRPVINSISSLDLPGSSKENSTMRPPLAISIPTAKVQNEPKEVRKLNPRVRSLRSSGPVLITEPLDNIAATIEEDQDESGEAGATSNTVAPPKKGRGRPKKTPVKTKKTSVADTPAASDPATREDITLTPNRRGRSRKISLMSPRAPVALMTPVTIQPIDDNMCSREASLLVVNESLDAGDVHIDENKLRTPDHAIVGEAPGQLSVPNPTRSGILEPQDASSPLTPPSA